MLPDDIPDNAFIGRYWTNGEHLVAVHTLATPPIDDNARYKGHSIISSEGGKGYSANYFEWNGKGECVTAKFDTGVPRGIAEYNLNRAARGYTFANTMPIVGCNECEESKKVKIHDAATQ